ncbi:DivIVA domain-containing protein [Brachybacterium sp. DNPG3]
MTPHRQAGGGSVDVRFPTTRFSEAYDMSDVDEFLARCEQALETGDGSVTPEDVRSARFRVSRFGTGYDQAAVDEFLDGVLVPRLAAAGPSADPATSDPAPSDAAGAAEAPADGGAVRSAGSPVGADGRDGHPAESRPGLFARIFGRSR